MSVRSSPVLRDKVVALKTSLLSRWGPGDPWGGLVICGFLSVYSHYFGTLLASSLSLALAQAEGELIINQKVKERREARPVAHIQLLDRYASPPPPPQPALFKLSSTGWGGGGMTGRLGLRLGCPL